jgi:hypothetical protein
VKKQDYSQLPRPEMTAEHERNLFRLHKRLHPNGRFQSSGRECEICMLFDLLDETRTQIKMLEDPI